MSDVYTEIPEQFNTEVYDLLKDVERLLYFQWDMQTDVLEFTEPTADYAYDLPQRIADASTNLWVGKIIHPDDTELLEAFFDKLFWRTPSSPNARKRSISKLRLKGKEKDSYLWVEFRLLIYYEDFRPAKAFGCICNINEQQVRQMQLQREIEYDMLTGFLNKSACHQHIDKYLTELVPEVTHPAMVIVDADGFKAINDTFGHLFGDAVLKDMAQAINKHFNDTSIIGRIGGDEFLVLYRDVKSLDKLKESCAALIADLDRTYQNHDDRLPFSVSIGISLFPEHGENYTDLFKHADRALYEAKTKGKNRYHIYQPSLIGNTSVKSERDPLYAADMQQKAFKDNMLEFIFNFLYETNDPDATVALCIQMFGKQFELDRVAVDRYNKLTNQYTTAFEWISPNGVSLKAEAHSHDVSDLINSRNEMILSRYHPTPYGVMSLCRDTGKAGNQYQAAANYLKLRSFVHCRITHGTDDIGCIGFESAKAPRTFTKEEISDVSIFAVLLGNILLVRDDDKTVQNLNDHLRDILDHMQEFIYVVDKDTYEPVFFNQTIRQGLQGISVNQPCYKRFHRLEAPCDGCPLNRLSLEGNEYIDTVLDNWGAPTNTRAYNIHWEDQRERHLALIIQDSF